ncbi:MAG: polyprenyl synthetase family protein [Armatimonadetes bacterium]|nr:polyprenyl synthetase family protein [Armatimonadota bacterium]
MQERYELLIHSELERVSRRIKQITDIDDHMLKAIFGSPEEGSGKRIRASLLLLCARLFGEIPDKAMDLAAAAEIIHEATLIHDDILDQTGVRRGKKTMNSIWGDGVALLMGDYMVCQAFAHTARVDHQYVPLFADTLKAMVSGEIIQHQNRFNTDLSISNYLTIIEKKTAVFFESCCLIGAQVAGASPAPVKKLSEYGRLLGIAFQLVDDILDYTGMAETLGKPTTNDLQCGRMTLPYLYSMAHAKNGDRELLVSFVEGNGSPKVELKKVTEAVHRLGGIRHSLDMARQYCDQAVEILSSFPDTTIRSALTDLGGFVLDRIK